MKYRKPFTYVFGNSFTNRKHRHIKESTMLLSEADFIAEKIFYTGPKCKIQFKDGEWYATSTKPFDSEYLTAESGGWPLFPNVHYPAGGRIEVELELDKDLNVGRKRPFFRLVFHGFMEYHDK